MIKDNLMYYFVKVHKNEELDSVIKVALPRQFEPFNDFYNNEFHTVIINYLIHSYREYMIFYDLDIEWMFIDFYEIESNDKDDTREIVIDIFYLVSAPKLNKKYLVPVNQEKITSNESGIFSNEDVIKQISDKVVYRFPQEIIGELRRIKDELIEMFKSKEENLISITDYIESIITCKYENFSIPIESENDEISSSEFDSYLIDSDSLLVYNNDTTILDENYKNDELIKEMLDNSIFKDYFYDLNNLPTEDEIQKESEKRKEESVENKNDQVYGSNTEKTENSEL